MKQSIQVQFDYDFYLIGIVSSLKVYRLSSSVNKLLNSNLLRVDDVLNQFGDDYEDASYARYAGEDEENEILYDLIANKNENVPLIKEKKEVDYFLIINGPDLKINIKSLISELNSIQHVQLAFELDVNTLKSKQNLILE